MAQKFHRPFSPTIMESTVPDRFVDIVNDTADKVLGSETASIEWDWSHKLVGKVQSFRARHRNANTFFFTDRGYVFYNSSGVVSSWATLFELSG